MIKPVPLASLVEKAASGRQPQEGRISRRCWFRGIRGESCFQRGQSPNHPVSAQDPEAEVPEMAEIGSPRSVRRKRPVQHRGRRQGRDRDALFYGPGLVIEVPIAADEINQAHGIGR